jgi:hypothetical protein
MRTTPLALRVIELEISRFPNKERPYMPGLQDFLVEDRPISPVEDHLTGSLAEPKATSLTLPFSCWQVCEP